MPTGDGLLVRLNPIDRSLSAGQLASLARAAGRLGNGLVEITSRGSLQLRGFGEASAAELADIVAELNIAVATGVAVETGPLAGLDPAEIEDPRPLATKLRRAIAGSGRRYGPKQSIVVDGGGELHLGPLPCDVRLEAMGDGRWWCDGAAVDDPVACVLDRLATSRRRLAGIARPASEPIGRHALRGGRFALGLGLPFGQVQADALEALACPPTTEFRLAPERALLAVGLEAGDVPVLTARAKALGLITEPRDPRRAVAACPGCPACASGEIPARAMAEAIAGRAAPLLDGSFTLHVSGCAKGCAHPRPALLSLSGVEGRCSLALDGTPKMRLWPNAAVDALAALADLVSERRRATGESAADCLARLGERRVAGLLLRDQVHA